MQQIYRRTPIPKCDFNKVALNTPEGLLMYVGRADLFFFFVFRSKFLVFLQKFSYGFCPVHFECDAILAVDHSFVYSYPKMFLLYSSLILTAWTWFPSVVLDSYLGGFFCLLHFICSQLQHWNSVISFPELFNLVILVIFVIQRNTILCLYLRLQTLISLSAQLFF